MNALFNAMVLAAEGGGTNPFAGSIYQAVAAAVVFIVVLLVLKKAAWGKILQGLQDREDRIRQDLEQAEQAAGEADRILQKYRTQLAEARAEARQILDQSRAVAHKAGQQIKDETQREMMQLRSQSTADINAAKEQAINEIYAQTAAMATQIAGQILRREIRVEDQAQLVESALQELARAQKN